MNVLDLRGPQFLELYLLLLILSTVTAIILRWLLRGPGGDPGRSISDLQPLEIAYLAGGPKGAIDAAITSLVRRGILAADGSTRRISCHGILPSGASALERGLYTLTQNRSRRIDDLRSSAQALADPHAHRLRQNELLITGGNAILIRILPTGVMSALLWLGIAKVMVGLDRNKPVGFLVLLCILTGIIALMFLLIESRRTRRGDAVLSRIRSGHSALRTTARADAMLLSDADAALALALYGPAILSGMPDLRLTLLPPPRPATSDGGSSWSSSCSSGSSCGGGSCGGGGCGGGGCGGCGGG
ncbi:MAG TPA: TIGR04222 domain-containing membrane protein [Humisphaera sp.]|jgi:uncharacterized protein (TIGR04222 family)|nr:TIGR04222 domain-containing membrane protein [Humisphaera sp.]